MTRTLLFLCALLSLSTSTVQAGKLNWAIAERDDGEITARIDKLRQVLGDRVANGDARILSDETYMNIDADGHVVMHNRVIEVLGEATDAMASREIPAPPGYEVSTTAGFVLRSDGSLERLRDREIRRLEASDGTTTSVLFTFPVLRRGDVYGYSFSTKAKGRMSTARLPLVDDLPVAYGMMLITTDGSVYYEFMLENVDEEHARIEELVREKARPRDVRVKYGPIEPVDESVFMRPAHQRMPRCTIRLNGINLRGVRWSELESWEEIARYVAYDAYYWMEYAEEILADAELPEIAANADALAKADAIARWLRDDLRLVENEVATGGFRRPDEVVDSGYATPAEKTHLMLAVLRSMDVTPRLALVREHGLGPVDRQQFGLDQFTDWVILVGDNADFRIYIPSDPGCEPGFVPPRLRDGDLFVPNVWRAEENVDRWRAFWEGEDLGARTIDSWFAWGKVPGSIGEAVGHTVEVLRYEGSGQASRVEIESEGYTDVVTALRSTAHKEWVANWLSWQRRAGENVRDVSTRVDFENRTTHAEVAFVVDLPALPPAMEDTWIVPADLLFGRSLFEGWTGVDRDEFYVDASRTMHWQTRLPLPPGWAGVLPSALPQVQHERFDYQAQVHVEEDELVLDRLVNLRAGATGRDGMQEIDAAIQQVLDFESNPLVFGRVDDGR